MTAPDPSIFELRMYDVVPGRLADEVGRLREVAIDGAPQLPDGPAQDGPSLFDLHGIPRPRGAWTSTVGPSQPRFLYLLRWENLTARDTAFPAFWADPRWQAIRSRTNAGSDIVEASDDWLVRPAAGIDLPPGPAGRIGGLHEMRLLQLLNGHRKEAAAALAETDLPLLRFLGAEVLGVLDVVIGPNMPTFALFLAWPDFAAQQHAWARLDMEPRILQRRDREMALFNRRLFGHVDSYLLDPVPGWGEPFAGFGAGP